MSSFIDLPCTYARVVWGDATPDSFITTLGDEDTTGEVVILLDPQTHVYPIKWADGPDDTVVLPDPPPGATLVGAYYVVKAYREADTGGGDSSGFGYHPNPSDAPYLVSDTTAHLVIDGLPIGGYSGLSVGTYSDDLSLLAAGTSGNFEGDAWTMGNLAPTFAGAVHLAYLALRLVYDGGDIEAPCDTWVDLDLSTAGQLSDDDGPQGEFSGGVIQTTGLNNPEFWFPFELDATRAYRLEVTYTGSGNLTNVYGLRPGSEDADHAAYLGGATTAYLGTASGDTVQTFTIGPGLAAVDGLPAWDDPSVGVAAGYSRLMFSTDVAGQVSAIRVRKICTTGIPPLQLTNRRDRYASAPSLTRAGFHRQGGPRLTGPI